MKIGTKVAAWALENLVIPAGHPDSGKPLVIAPYFVRFFNEAFQDEIIEAFWSGPRGQGKTSSCCALILFFLAGPGYRPGFRSALMSTNAAVAQQVVNMVMEMAEASGVAVESRTQPAPGRIIATDGDAECAYVNSGASSHLGTSYDLVVADEIGEMDPRKARKTVEMAMTSCAKRGGLFVGIGVRAWSPLFNEAAERAALPTTIWHEFSGAPDARIDSVRNIRRANPAVKAGILDIKPLLRAARRARGSTALEYDYRSYVLNEPSQPRQDMLISFGDWKKYVEVKTLPPREGPCLAGWDLGGGPPA